MPLEVWFKLFCTQDTDLRVLISYIKKLTLSMASAQPSGKGAALMNNLLCLFGDLERQVTLDSSETVSLYDTTGSDFLRGIQA